MQRSVKQRVKYNIENVIYFLHCQLKRGRARKHKTLNEDIGTRSIARCCRYSRLSTAREFYT